MQLYNDGDRSNRGSEGMDYSGSGGGYGGSYEALRAERRGTAGSPSRSGLSGRDQAYGESRAQAYGNSRDLGYGGQQEYDQYDIRPGYDEPGYGSPSRSGYNSPSGRNRRNRDGYGALNQGYDNDVGAYGQRSAYGPGGAGGYGSTYDLNQGTIDALSPLAVPKELFVNVIVTEISEDNPLNHVTNWLGKVTKGTHQHGENKATEISPEIATMVRRSIYAHGWDSDVVPMMLPPSHGLNRWSPTLRLGVDQMPFLLVFRVQLRTKLKVNRQDGGGLAEFFTGCCDMIAPPSIIHPQEYDSIAMEIQDGLRRQNQAQYGYQASASRVIRAEIQVVSAIGQFQVLKSKGWTADLSSQAILQARNQHPQSVTEVSMFGGNGQSQYGGQQGMGGGLFGGSGGGGLFGGSSQQDSYGQPSAYGGGSMGAQQQQYGTPRSNRYNPGY